MGRPGPPIAWSRDWAQACCPPALVACHRSSRTRCTHRAETPGAATEASPQGTWECVIRLDFGSRPAQAEGRKHLAAVVNDTNSLGCLVAVGRFRPEEPVIAFVVAHEDVSREFSQGILGDWNTNIVGVERVLVAQ